MDGGVQVKTKQAQRAPGEVTRALLLATAAELMTDGEGVAITLADIAKRSGMNSALVKYHFGSKDGLLLALAGQICADAMARFQGLVSSDRPPLEKLELHIAAFIRFYARYPFLSSLLHELQTSPDPKIRAEVFKAFLEPLIAHQKALLDEAVAAGVIRTVDPGLFLFSVIGACHYPFVNRGALKTVLGTEKIDEPMKDRFISHTTALLLNGLKD